MNRIVWKAQNKFIYKSWYVIEKKLQMIRESLDSLVSGSGNIDFSIMEKKIKLDPYLRPYT